MKTAAAGDAMTETKRHTNQQPQRGSQNLVRRQHFIQTAAAFSSLAGVTACELADGGKDGASTARRMNHFYPHRVTSAWLLPFIMMNRALPLLTALLLAPLAAHALDIEWVTVGDAGNAPDKTGYGAVAYEFQIAKFEVTVGQYAEFLNAVAANLRPAVGGLWGSGMGSELLTDKNLTSVRSGSWPVFINRIGASGPFRYQVIPGQENKPVVFVNFLSAMRFVNWLHNGQGKGDTETGAYDIAKHGGLARHEPGAKVWIATENEWYKAAYFQPQSKGGPPGGYWLYPTRSNEQPQFRAEGAAEPNSANYSQKDVGNLPGGVFANTFPAGSHPGSASYYGTFDQGGNAWEWTEAVVFDTQRGMRGGCVAHTFEKLKSVVRTSSKPERGYPDTGFRIARAVPKAGDAASVKPTTPKQP